MFDFNKEKERFVKECSACGVCVTSCPIIPMTELRDIDPSQIMEEVLNLYQNKAFDKEIVKTRVYSCMGCNTCKTQCPEGLDPGLGLTLARQLLIQIGEPLPRGLSFLLPDLEFNLIRVIESIQIKPGKHPWLTDVDKQRPRQSNTVLFTGCLGLMQPDVILAALDLVHRIDPDAQALGGLKYCCGDIHLRTGHPEASIANFTNLVRALDTFSPKNVVFICPTCKSYFDLHKPDTEWSWHFITEFLIDHLDKLGEFKEIKAKVTIHDACHLVRGEEPDSETPRKILSAIPGIDLIEIENSKETSLCCGGSAIAGVGKPGLEFRNHRLKQVKDSGAEVMCIYCPGCQSVFAPVRRDLPFKIDSIITILGESLGIRHEDKLLRYFRYHDGQRVLSEAKGYIESSGLPEDKLRNFILKYFR